MRTLALSTALILAACAQAPQGPQNFKELLKITDTTDDPICSLSLTELRANVSAEALEAAKADAFDTDKIVAAYADDPAAQIRINFRRAALKRRLNAVVQTPELANKYYAEMKPGEMNPKTLKAFHDAYHFWMDRISEQDQHGTPESPEYNLRFCVMNEKRAVLHAASRADILTRVKAGVTLPAPELIENINHETVLETAFSAKMMSKIFTPESVKNLSPLDIGKMRSDQSFMSFDPKTAEAFWSERDEELSAMMEFIEKTDFPSPAEKLKYMTDVDQSVRKFLSEADAKAHFETEAEYDAFRPDIFSRLSKVDKFNTAELQKMLDGRGWFRDDIDGDNAARHAWLIAQHADQNPDFQQDVLTLIEAELDAPGVSKSNYAYLYDRVQIRYADGIDGIKKLQRYATQGRCSGPGTWEPFPFENPDDIDATRANVGLGTLAEYKSRFKNMCTEDQR